MYQSFERKIDLKLVMSMIATGLMCFTGIVVETAMNVAFPTLMKQFHINTSAVQWVTTAYLLVLAIIIPTSSFLKKRFTTKSLFIVAILLFTGGVVLDAVAPTFGILILGRIIQGIGTGIALPLMFNIVLEQVPFEKLGLMMGLATLIIAVAPAIGPSVGGMIINKFGWRIIFLSLLPILVIAFFLGVFSIRQVRAIEKISLDWIGYLFLAICFSSFIFATSSAGNLGWTNSKVLILLLISIVTLAIYSIRSLKVDNPIINLKVFTNSAFSFSMGSLLLIQFICLGLAFLIPNYSQLVSGNNPSIAGSLLLPGCIVGAILTPVSGRLLDIFGAKKPILIGQTIIIIATLCFSIFAKNLTTFLFMVFYIIFTFGQGFSVGNTMTNGLKQLPENLKPDGNAVLNTLQQLSGAIGTSIISTIVAISQKNMPDNLPKSTMIGSQNAFIFLCILSVIALSCSFGVFYFKKREVLVREEI